MTTFALPARRSAARGGGTLWWLLGASAGALLAGVATAAAPLIVLGLTGAVLATGAFLVAPALLLAGILLVRPSLDTSDAVFSVGGVNLAGVIGVVLVAGALPALVLARPRLPARGVLVAPVLFCVFALASIAWGTLSVGEGLRIWIRYAGPFIVLALAMWTVRDLAGVRRMARIILLASVFPLGFGLFELATGQTLVKEGFASIDGPFVHPNGLGLMLMVTIGVALVTALESPSPAHRRWLLVFIALAGVAWLNTYARVAWLGLGMVLAVLAVLHYRRLVAVGLVALVGAVLFAPGPVAEVVERFADVGGSSATNESSVAWRVGTWQRMLPYATADPAHGQGVGSYGGLSNGEFGIFDYEYQTPDVPGTFGSQEVPAHNDYLVLAIEFGVPGLVLWIVAFVVLAVAVARARRRPGLRPYALLGVALLVALAAGSLSDNVKDYSAVVFPVFALCGAVLGAAAHRDGAGREPAGR